MGQINNPTDINGCILWLDGSDAGTVFLEICGLMVILVEHF